MLGGEFGVTHLASLHDDDARAHEASKGSKRIVDCGLRIADFCITRFVII